MCTSLERFTSIISSNCFIFNFFSLLMIFVCLCYFYDDLSLIFDFEWMWFVINVGLDLYIDMLFYTLVNCSVINFADLWGLSLRHKLITYLVWLLISLSAINLFFSSIFLIFLNNYFFSWSITFTVCVNKWKKVLRRVVNTFVIQFWVVFITVSFSTQLHPGRVLTVAKFLCVCELMIMLFGGITKGYGSLWVRLFLF